MREPDVPQAHSTAALTTAPPALRRGACPSLDEPMQTGDGLLARLRIPGDHLTPRRLQAIAETAARYGNGQLEITARGNLQARGLTHQTAPRFAEAIETIVPIERGLVVETPPLAGIDPLERADPRPLASAIRARSVAGLGPKVTVIVDGGGQIDLVALGADIRFSAISPDHWQLSVANTPVGSVATASAAAAAEAILTLIAAHGEAARGRDLPPEVLRQAVAAHLTGTASPSPRPATSAIGEFTLDQGFAAGIALPFGSIDSDSLIALARSALVLGITDLRLAPHHALLALAADPAMLAAWIEAAANLGFITAPTDPRGAVSACIGSEGCASGHLAARSLAAGLSEHHRDLLDGSITLHVSGCAKGCAHPRAAALTLVGAEDNCALVLNGLAGDMPLAEIASARMESALTRLTRQRLPGETTAACLTRLGASTIAGLFRQE
ncbi:precorrin-3B synthase [Devosia yakushimensis]|uniref:Precorrin-3B synthase n=1 Tax=Devosia yakushimensis TaxID=470028 RepID=A0ABQ5UGT5_9HYPH|nr:precorrin-3B synthase [Devosia yakushimensis]GLQ10374.1 precorrin-3B synthase [Devosia yakushimensis]